MASPEFTSLYPAAGSVDADGLISSLQPARPEPTGRPYTIVNFVASVDGRAAFEGRSRAFGDQGDRALFHALRERADAILAGARTMQIENYGRTIPDPERRARRVAAGRSPEPVAVTISRHGEIPLEIPLFAEPEAHVIVFSPVQPSLEGVQATVEFEALQAGPEPALAEAMATLLSKYEVRLLLCEGGPSLFGALLRAGLVDELFLTVAAKLAGGDSGPSITSGPPLPEPGPMQLAWVLERESTLYLRYAVTS